MVNLKDSFWCRIYELVSLKSFRIISPFIHIECKEMKKQSNLSDNFHSSACFRFSYYSHHFAVKMKKMRNNIDWIVHRWFVAFSIINMIHLWRLPQSRGMFCDKSVDKKKCSFFFSSPSVYFGDHLVKHRFERKINGLDFDPSIKQYEHKLCCVPVCGK